MMKRISLFNFFFFLPNKELKKALPMTIFKVSLFTQNEPDYEPENETSLKKGSFCVAQEKSKRSRRRTVFRVQQC